MKLNGVNYKIPELDFNTVADLQDCGVNIYDGSMLEKRPLILARAFVALATGLSTREAGNVLGEHLATGGDLNDIYGEIGKAIEESRFLQQMIQKAQEQKPAEE